MNDHRTKDPAGARHRRSIAQAMAEFGLALPILLLVVYGVIETGRLVLIYASVVSAARNAARYGSVAGDNGSGTPYYNDCSGIVAAADRLAFLEKFKTVDVSYDMGPGAGDLPGGCPVDVLGHPVNGDRINVSVSADYSPIVPLVPFGSFPISSTASRTLLIGVPIGVDVPPVILTPGATGTIAIEKDASPTVYHYAGEVITYTYTLKNQGSDPALGIIVHDDKVGSQGGSNNCGATSPIAGGTNATCTATYTITAADIANGTLTNIASFVATVGGIQYSAFTSLTINFAATPHITLAKSGISPVDMVAGAQVEYSFVLTNDGNVNLTGPYSISDPNLGSAASCPPDNTPLPVGGTITCTGYHSLTNNDINNGVINNTATASAKYRVQTVTSAPASAIVYVPPLLLQASASPATVTYAGQIVTYTYTLTNRTNKDTTNIVLSDTNPAASYACGAATLAPGASTSCTRQYTVTTADMNQDVPIGPVQIVDQAIAAAINNKKSISSNRVTVIVTVNQIKTLSLTKTAATSWPSASDAPAVPGPSVTYSYVLKNTGNVTLSPPYTVTDNKVTVTCAGSVDLAPGPDGNGDGDTVACTDVTYTLVQADLDNGSIINSATGTAKFGTQTISSPQTSATVITYHAARLKLTTTFNPAYWQNYNNAGTLLTFTYALRNTGGVPLAAPYTLSHAVKVDDWNCASAISPLPVGGTTTCTGHYTTNPSDNKDSPITSTAQFTAMNDTTGVDSNLVSVSVPAFSCTNLKPIYPPPGDPGIPNGLDVTWTIRNNTGLDVHITSMFVRWNAYPPALIQVFLNSVSIYNYANSSYTGTYVDTVTQPWILPTGQDSVLEYRFFNVAASNIIVDLTFKENCPLMDSNAVYQ